MGDWSKGYTANSFELDSQSPVLKFRYKVRLVTNDPGKTPVFKSINLRYSLASAGVNTDLPRGFALTGNHPNPFNPSTSIAFTLPAPGVATIAVFDRTGRKVRTLLSGRLSPGAHTARWDGRDDRGEPVSSGAYIAVLDFGGKSVSHRMLLVK
jgi:hypothetical protein